MKFKAIFIDVDGTLLTDGLSILPGTKEVVKRLSGSGLLVSIVTARSPDASLFLYDELGITGQPIICFNGALVLHDDTLLLDENIGSSQVHELLCALKEFRVTVSLYRHRKWYAEVVDYWIRQEMEITGSEATEADFSVLLSLGFRPNKILCMGEPADIDAAEMHLKRIGFDDLNIHKSKPAYLEIMNRAASKQKGIETLAEAYKIKREEIIAIGDNFNDIDMLLWAGTSIVMGNAPEAVKKYATFVTDTNNREGIQKALDRFIIPIAHSI